MLPRLVAVFFLLIPATTPPSLVAGRKLYSQCRFMWELVEDHRLSDQEAAKWSCLVNGITSTTTVSRHGPEPKQPVGNYLGIFKIGSEWWCSEEGRGGCNIECDKLLDDDITDDLRCAQEIGFEGYPDLKACFDKGWQQIRDMCLNKKIQYSYQMFKP